MGTFDDDVDGDELDIDDAIDLMVKDGVKKIRTVEPGYVLDYDHTSQKATIQLAIRERLGGNEIKHPPCVQVAVCHWTAGGWSFTAPLRKGDRVLVLFCDRSIDEYVTLASDDVTAAGRRKHDFNDAIAIPMPIMSDNAPRLGVEADTLLIGTETDDEDDPKMRLRISPTHIEIAVDRQGESRVYVRISATGKVSIGTDADGNVLDKLNDLAATLAGPAPIVSTSSGSPIPPLTTAASALETLLDILT